MSYGAENWLIMVTPMRMICGKTLKDRIKSGLILKMTVVETLKEFLRSQRLRWFVHIKNMSKEKAPAMAMKLTVKDKKKKDQKTMNKSC